MKHLRYLLMAALVAMPLTACDDDNNKPIVEPPAVGTISGTVTAEGTGLAGVSVTLVGSVSTTETTATDGSFTFSNVTAGNYGVTIGSLPSDVTFSSMSTTTAITTDGQTATVQFTGAYIRTASIAGQVIAGSAGIPAVSVTASGPEGTSSAVTGSGGNFSFTNLRAGDYTVAMAGVSGYVFETTSYTVTVGTGETKNAVFSGTEIVVEDPVTATVVIHGVTTAGIPVNPSAIAGQIDVTLQIDPGENDLNKIALLLDGTEIASQTLGSSVPEQGPEMVAGNLEVVFSLNTAEFDSEDGSVTYPNGTYEISAELGLENAQASTVETSMNLTFANADRFIGRVTPSASAIGTNGFMYYGGDIVAAALPVLYSGKTVSSVTFAFSNTGLQGASAQGPFAATAPGLSLTDAAAPFEATFSSGAGEPLEFYQTASANVAGETMKVTAAMYADGTVFDPTAAVLPITLQGGSAMSIDNVGPQVIGPDNALATADDILFALPNQVTGATHPAASANNWISANFLMSDANLGLAVMNRDNVAANSGGPGVGGVRTTYHMGNATMTQSQVAALPAIIRAGDADLGPTLVNTAYEPVMVLTDALGNATVVGLSASADNPAAVTVGQDDLAPTAQALSAGSQGDLVIYNTSNLVAGGFMNFSATDDRAGFSATPLRIFVERITAAGTTYSVGASATDGGYVNEALNVGACAGALEANGSPCVPDGLSATDAYYTVSGHLVDQAGNEVATDITRRILKDGTVPTAGNVTIPSTTLVGGAATSFGFTVADNLDLWSVGVGFDFSNSGVFVPFGEDVSVGDSDRWNGKVVTTASGSFTFPFVRALELAPGGVPSGVMSPATNVRAIAEDAAGNQSLPISNNFVAGSVPAGVSFTTAPAMASWTVPTPSAAFNLCNGQGGAPCPVAAGNGTEVSVGAKATGPSGTYANPFAGGQVYFYTIIDPTPASYASGDEQVFYAGQVDGASATVADTGATRTYSWTFTLTSDMVASFPNGTAVQVVGIGTSAAGDAILTSYNGNVTVINGN